MARVVRSWNSISQMVKDSSGRVNRVDERASRAAETRETADRRADIVAHSDTFAPCGRAAAIKRSTFSSVALKSREESCSALSNGKSSTRTVSSAKVREDAKTPTRIALESDASAANTSMQPISAEANMISRLQTRPGTLCVI